MRLQLPNWESIWECVGSFPHTLLYFHTFELHSWPTPLQALALVANPRPGLRHKSKQNPNVQIEKSRNPKNGNEKIMKENLKKLHAWRKIWKPHGITSLCWIFYYVNDNAEVDLVNTQIMHCIFYYQNPILRIIGINPRTQAREGLIFLLLNQWNNFTLKTSGCI